MGPRKTGNSVRDRIEQFKYDLQTKWWFAVIEHIEPLLYKLFSYKEKKESSLKPGESSRMIKIASVTSDQLLKVQLMARDYYREAIEPEVKETIEHNIEAYMDWDMLDDYVLVIKEKLSTVRIVDEYDFSNISSEAVRDTLASLASEEKMKHKKSKFVPGENVQQIKIDLERVDARINEYAEMLARLNIIDEETVQKVNKMLKPLNAKENKWQPNAEKSEREIQINKMNYALEQWFQEKLRLIIASYESKNNITTSE